MALGPCRECSRMISEEAGACPHCGAPSPVRIVPRATATPGAVPRSRISAGRLDTITKRLLFILGTVLVCLLVYLLIRMTVSVEDLQ